MEGKRSSAPPTLQVCEVCGARVPAVRRGRCPACYLRWAEARPVGRGAVCIVCGERRMENLRRVEFQGAWLPMCHNCGTRLMRLHPVPRTIEGLRQRLGRDRRWHERRCGGADPRHEGVERRVGERRAPPLEVDDSWEEAEDLIVEILEASIVQESSGETCIAPASGSPGPAEG